jgi:DNA-directed RNA polymerase subunit beta'
MADTQYERINEYDSVRISLASPEDIRSWSYGEVKKPETINYRTYRPERDGLFCERIFGPERDWECSCGKYRGMKHKGIVCDRCGVKVTHSKVRRRRMGHINLAAPVVHIWFFKGTPCRLGNLLCLKSTELERIIYFQDYVITDPGDTPLKHKQLLTEEDYRHACSEYGEHAFRAQMGAEAVRELLRQLELAKLAEQLRDELKEATSQQRYKEITKQVSVVESLRDSGNKAEWMILEVLPVIPPDLRPLVLLDSGNFATSDLNDLYRRIINRNNRLRRLLDLNAPDVIIRNEKRMLQQAVDALFDNSRCKRSVLGPSNRPLKSLTDMIKGKQGRFRENLLGKRVDYSARSVIVVGPELHLHQCGLPKKIALELYQPFIIRRLRERGMADTIKSARKMLERKDEQVWDVLEEVIERHPVLLNRAPTLHRMGIQAFDPVLVEGNAIKLHPLVCKGFNADFDGDAMAVHLPLSIEAQVEAKTLMMAPHNVFTPQSGDPIITPSQDMVLGCYWLTVEGREQPKHIRQFANEEEVLMAYDDDVAQLQDRIELRPRRIEEIVQGKTEQPKPVEGRITTTVGRIYFHNALPEGMPLYNFSLDSKGLSRIIQDCYKRLGRQATVEVLDTIKELGFKEATKAGLSFAITDLLIPPEKERILDQTQTVVNRIEKEHRQGAITMVEKQNRVVDEWNAAAQRVSHHMLEELKNDTREGRPYLNPVYMMMDSGARGSSQQILQLAGMRGLMSKPSGEIIETPIKANFREGLNVLEYFSSTHGARKGLADTALKTADSGYLTRKLADVAQNVIVSMYDCQTTQGITKGPVTRGDRIEVPLSRMVVGRIARDNIVNLITDEVIVRENEMITEEKAQKLEELDERMKLRVRSPLTCEASRGVCAMCYGMDLARKDVVEEGLAVGIIAAQSIGEPGTQLTMRTFHIGGIAMSTAVESEVRALRDGTVKYEELEVVEDPEGRTVTLSRQGQVLVVDDKGRELDRHAVPLGAQILVEEGKTVKRRAKLAQWDANITPILSSAEGRVRYEDIVEGKTLREETDTLGVKRRVITEHKGDMHPQIVIEGDEGKILALYPIPEKAVLEVVEGQEVTAGTRLARTLREIRRTQDITGGLPRVTEIFEARKPKDPAVMSEIEGYVSDIERRRGRTVIKVRNADSGLEVEHTVPTGKHLRVSRGDRVTVGQALVDGPLVLQEILRISGEESLQQYMLNEVQNVYRSQSVTIDDKHIEIIISQMTRRVRVTEPGDTRFLPGDIVDRFTFRERNERVVAQGGKPASSEPVLLGVTKAALRSDSFISAASFQETTKVLTQAALASRSDILEGLKENVIVGHLVPAGTGFRAYFNSRVEMPALPGVENILEDSSDSE